MAGLRKRARPNVESEDDTLAQEDARDGGADAQAHEHADQDNEGLSALKFRHALTWKAGKAIDVGELIKRLSSLHNELMNTEHGEIDLDTLMPVAQELAHPQLLTHKDRGVQACVAVCLVDVFRLFAPNAPYKEKQFKDIFSLFIDSIIPALARRSDAYHEHHLIVLKALYEYELFTILSDFNTLDNLVARLYMKVFDMFALRPTLDTDHDAPSQTVYVHLSDALTGLTSHYDNLPKGVVDIVLAQFLRADPSIFAQTSTAAEQTDSAASKQVPLSYHMAQSICNEASEVITRAISQYFSTIIVDASDPSSRTSTSHKTPKLSGKRRRGSDDVLDQDDEATHSPSDQQMKELRKVHRLLRELWRSCPEVTQSVVLQINAELSADHIEVRAIATETVGDMVAGIGAAGPPPRSVLDPVAYPSIAIEARPTKVKSSFFMTPSAIHPFSTVHPTIYQTFITRKQDKAPQVRATFAACVGRILSTSAGGLGLDHHEEQVLLDALAEMLLDKDDKVRLAAVRAVAYCDYNTIVQKIGKHNGIDAHGSVLYNVADRIRDPKHTVRSEAIRLLGQLWGVASDAIIQGSEKQRDLFGPIPSKILEALYVNDKELTAVILDTLYTCLLPINFPPKKDHTANKNSQSAGRGHDPADSRATRGAFDADAIRAERLLTLVNDLTEKAKTVFFALQRQQVVQARHMKEFIKQCEAYNGGVASKSADTDLQETKQILNKYVTFWSGPFQDSMTAADHLWRFIKLNMQRSYVLLGYIISPDRNYDHVRNSIKELSKRVLEKGSGNSDMLATLHAILYKCSVFVYNKSHVPTITEIARTDENGLGSAAHEVLKEILDNHPEILEAHVRGICDTVIKDAPKEGHVSTESTVKSLKACASFAMRDPAAMPQERGFLQSMVKYALHGTQCKAAKHAVTVIASMKGKRDMYIRDIAKQCTQSFKYGEPGFLSHLASMSQLMLLTASDLEDYTEQMEAIAINDVLLRSAAAEEDLEAALWHDEIHDDCMAKILALKILANRLRYYASATSDHDTEAVMKELATKLYQILLRILRNEGGMSSTDRTPGNQKAWLRLTAAILLLKLSCASKIFDQCLSADDFQTLALVAQDSLPEVRSRFFRALKKYLGQGALPARFYAIPFVMAFEPSPDLREMVTSWIRARASTLARADDSILELTLARFISLLVHHPDFSMDLTDLEGFPQYILFYLKAVATKSNISLLYHVAQRIKSVQDGINHEANEGLYCLSEMTQAIIREYAECNNWQLPAWNGKFRMPAGIFGQLPSHSKAQEIADKQFAPIEFLETLDEVVRESLKSKKRKSDSAPSHSRKRTKTNGVKAAKPARRASTETTTKTPKRRKGSDVAMSSVTAGERRRSTRTSNTKSYAGMADSDEEEEDGGEDEDEDEVMDDIDGREDENESEGQEDGVDDVEMAESQGSGIAMQRDEDSDADKENQDVVFSDAEANEDEAEQDDDDNDDNDEEEVDSKRRRGSGKSKIKDTVKDKAKTSSKTKQAKSNGATITAAARGGTKSRATAKAQAASTETQAKGRSTRSRRTAA